MNEAEWLTVADPIAMVEFLRGSPTGADAVTWSNSRWRFEASEGRDHKFRWFACACCRRIWDAIPEECNRDAVAAVEDFLDGGLPAAALQTALVASSAVEGNKDGSGKRSEPGYWAVKYLGRGFYKLTAAASALIVAAQVLFMADEEYGREAANEFFLSFYTANGVFFRPFRWPVPIPAPVAAERAAQVALLHCIFGNPFRPQRPVDPRWLAWNDGTLQRLAEAAYEDRELPSGRLDNARQAILADALEDAGCAETDILGHLRQQGAVHVRGCWAVDLVRSVD
jgi:hypothetical protein